MDSQDKISIAVIIPVYNCKKYLNDAIVSVLEQPYKNIGIVLVDDGSTDGSSELCDKWKAINREIHVIHKQNGGVSSARNAGIDYILSKKQVDGLFIGFLDADDIWNSNIINNDVAEKLREDISLYGFTTYYCNNALTYHEYYKDIQEGVFVGGQEATRLYTTQVFGAMLYSASMLKANEIRFMENLKYSEDRLFSQQCLYLAEKIVMSNQPLYFYRNCPSSAVHTRSYGIKYYTPMFEAYLSSDEHINSFSDMRDADMGHAFIGWYMVDMMREHYMYMGRSKNLEKWFEIHPEYVMIAEIWGGGKME